MSNLFVRKATGMVRSWSVFDAFIYAFFSINLVTLGFYSFSQMYYFGGGLIPALLISAVFIIFEVIVYASLIAVMPRSGGDYVWQTRIFGGGIGFILSITGWWFTLWLWTPIYGDMLRQIVITPLLGVLGLRDLAVWFAGRGTALFVCSLLTLVFVSIVIMRGMKSYARVQKYSFYAGMLGLLIVIVLLFTGSPDAFRAGFEQNSAAIFGTQPGLHEATAAAGTEAGAATPLTGGSLGLILLTLPWLVFFNLWPNWGATLYGEVRGATDYKRNFAGMAWALVAVTVLGIIFFLGVARTIGWDFYMQANAAWWNYSWGYTDQVPPLPVWPNPAMLAVFLTNNRLIQIIVMLLMSCWWFGWAGTLFLSSTRVVFAAAFDRLLPEKVAELDERTGTPVNAMLLMVIPAVIVSLLYAYNIGGFISVTLAATQAIAIMYFGTAIAAIILPYKKKALFEASPIAQMKIAGIPVISIAGAIFALFLGFLLVEWFFDPWLNTDGVPPGLYGISLANTNSVVFLLATYGLAALLYYGFKARRRNEGIDLDKVQAEIPVE
jgi:basic amino acid/polyamine antiporter, APA family